MVLNWIILSFFSNLQMEHLFYLKNISHRLGRVLNGSSRTWVLGFGNHFKMENRRKMSRTINDSICLLFCSFLFLWNQLSTFHLRSKMSSASLWFCTFWTHWSYQATTEKIYVLYIRLDHSRQISSQILNPWRGNIVDSSIELSYRHAI